MIYQTQTVEIEIIAEASLVHRHTSVMLDVKTRANEIDFFNIYVDESPIVPYEIYRRYVSGSPQGSVTISGDTIGIAVYTDTDCPVHCAGLVELVHLLLSGDIFNEDVSDFV